MKFYIKEFILIIIFGIILFITGEVFAQSVILTTTEVQENDNAVKILFSTNKSIPIECYDLSVPPQVIVDFMGEIYTNKPEVIMVNKGLVKQMRVVKGTKKSMDLDDSFYAIDFIIVDLETSTRYDFDQGLTNAVLLVSKPGKKISDIPAAKEIDKIKAKAEPEPVVVAKLAPEQKSVAETAKVETEREITIGAKAVKSAAQEKTGEKEQTEKIVKKQAKTIAKKNREIKTRDNKKQKTAEKKAAGQETQNKTVMQKAASGPKAVGRGIARGVGSIGRGIKNIFTFGAKKEKADTTETAAEIAVTEKKDKSEAEKRSVVTKKRRVSKKTKTKTARQEKEKTKKSSAAIKSKKGEKVVKPRKVETSTDEFNYKQKLDIAKQKFDENQKQVKELTARLTEAERDLDAAVMKKEAMEKKLEELERSKREAKSEYEQSLKYKEVSKNAANSVWTQYTNAKAELSDLLKQGVGNEIITAAEEKYNEKKEQLERSIAAAEEAKNNSDTKNNEFLKIQDQYDSVRKSLDYPKTEIKQAQLVHDDIRENLAQAKSQELVLAKELSLAKRTYQQYKLEKDNKKYIESLAEIDSTIIERIEDEKKAEEEAKLQAEAEKQAKEDARLAALEIIEEKEDKETQKKTRRTSTKRRKTKVVEKSPTELEVIKEDILESALELRTAGLEMQRLGDFDSAMKYYQQALLKDPNYAAVHNDLGILYEQKGLDEKAKMEYLNTLKLNPHYIKAHSNLALLYEKLGDNNKAYYHWKQRVVLGNENDPWTQKAKERMELLEKKK
ncbi:MAG: tetratricopeptide repeat protein [Candidatus Omnitrophota bacterium]